MSELPLPPWPMSHGDPKGAGWVVLFYQQPHFESLIEGVYHFSNGWIHRNGAKLEEDCFKVVGWRPLWDPQPPEMMPGPHNEVLVELDSGAFCLGDLCSSSFIKNAIKSWQRLYPSPAPQPVPPDDDLPDVDMYIHKVPESQLLAELVRRAKERDRQWAATVPPKKEEKS